MLLSSQIDEKNSDPLKGYIQLINNLLGTIIHKLHISIYLLIHLLVYI